MRKELRSGFCGVLGWRPWWLQGCVSVQLFTFWSSLLTAVAGMNIGYLISVLTTIERRFAIPSSKSGLLLSMYDIGHCIFVLLVGHFGTHLHQPKSIGIGAILSAVGCLGLASPHFIFGPFNPNQHQTAFSGDVDSSQFELCSQNTTLNFSLAPSDADFCPESTEMPSSVPYIILTVAQLVIGIGSSTFNTLTYVFIDDNCTKKQAPFYLGMMTAMWGYGPALGFGLGAFCTHLYVTLEEAPNGLGPESEGWLGAWWLGLILLAVLYFLIAIPFFFYPKSVRRHQLEQASAAEVEAKPAQKNCAWFFKVLATLPMEVINMFRNPIVVTMLLWWTTDSYIIGGYYTFLPKYLEVQFQKPAFLANISAGVIEILGGATAIAIGGKLLSYFSPRPKKSLILVILTSCNFLITLIVLSFVSCQQPAMEPSVSLSLSEEPMNGGVGCWENCLCDSTQSFPICSESTTFLSPCFAGCQAFNVSAGSFQNCLCTASGSASTGACEANCDSRLLIYLIASFGASFVGALFAMAIYTTLIWSVPPEKKSITIALANFLCSVLGFIPSQVLFGWIVDQSCSRWSSASGCGEGGFCRTYDTNKLRLDLHLGAAAFEVGLIIIGILGWYFARSFTFYLDEETEGGEDKQNKSDSVGDGAANVDTLLYESTI